MEEQPPVPNLEGQFTPSLNTKKSSGVSKLLVIIAGLVVLVLIGVLAYLLRGQFSSTPIEPSPSPKVVIEEPTPTPSPSFDRSKYSLRVLNGTSTSGLAGSVSAKLKEMGYTADKTGNASSSAVKQTTVRVKADLADLLEQLIKDLAPDYDGVSGTSLKDSDTVDAEVILGAK